MKSKLITLDLKDNKVRSETTKEAETNELSSNVSKKKKLTFLSFFKLRRQKKKRVHKKYRKVFLISLLTLTFLLSTLTVLFIYFVAIPAQRINHSVNIIQDNIYALGGDFKGKDLTKIDLYFENIQAELLKIDNEISRYEFLKNYEATKGYYDNLIVTRNILDKTDTLLIKTLPRFKTALEATGFKVEETSADTTTQNDESAFSLMIKELPQYLSLYEEIEPDILDIMEEVKKINPEYIPSIPDYDVEGKYTKVLHYIDEYPETSNRVKTFAEQVPNLIGAQNPVNYMVVLQNETEMRSSGGLLTAVGNATINQGEFGDVQNMKDMWDLEIFVSYTLGIDTGYRNIYGQNFLMNYGCGSTYLRAQDAGIYPDLYESLNIFKDYYDVANVYDPGSYPAYDHIVILNHHSAETILGLIQPLEVEGFGLVTADNLFDFIKAESDNVDKYQNDLGERKSVIGNIANAAKEKFFDLPLEQMPKVAETFIKIIQGKDIGFYSKDAAMQAYFDKYGMSGRQTKDFDGDYFHLNEAQNCALKLNRYMRDKVAMNVYIEDDGRVRKDVNVHWWQPQVYNDSISKYYDSSTTFSYRAWVRLFTPPGSYDFNSDGYSQSGYLYYWPEEYYDDIANKQISDNIIQFDHRRFSEADPIPEHDLNVSFRAPDSVNYNQVGAYKLLIQKHPGKSWSNGYEEYTINIHQANQTQSIKFQLDRDKVLTYKDGVIQVDNYDKSLDWVMDIVQKIPFEKFGDN